MSCLRINTSLSRNINADFVYLNWPFWTKCFITRNGIQTAQRYVDEILRPHAVPYAANVKDSTFLMHDNSRSHTIRLLGSIFKAETMQRMKRTVHSPDFYPVQYAWDTLGRPTAARPKPCTWRLSFLKNGTVFAKILSIT